MVNISKLKWNKNIPITLQKIVFLSKTNLKKFSARDRTGDLSVMSSPTRPLHQKNLFKIKANSYALSNKHVFLHSARAAGISNVQIFKSLRSPRKCWLQVGNSNSFDMCSGGSKVFVASFFLHFDDFLFQDSQNCLT